MGAYRRQLGSQLQPFLDKLPENCCAQANQVHQEALAITINRCELHDMLLSTQRAKCQQFPLSAVMLSFIQQAYPRMPEPVLRSSHLMATVCLTPKLMTSWRTSRKRQMQPNVLGSTPNLPNTNFIILTGVLCLISLLDHCLRDFVTPLLPQQPISPNHHTRYRKSTTTKRTECKSKQPF